MISPLTEVARPCTAGRPGCLQTVEREMPPEVSCCFDCRMRQEWGDCRRLPGAETLPAVGFRPNGLGQRTGGRRTSPWRGTQMGGA